jgi:DMSO/TMAO reductase YedYZ molybdopterin-dependent catalytic subunit
VTSRSEVAMPWRRALVGGAGAAIAAGSMMTLARSAGQVRSLPERMLEWMLLFVPLDMFGAMLGAFGFEAKLYALYGSVLFSLAGLTLGGAFALRSGLQRPALAAIGPALWLFAMIIVMPLTSAGLFARDLVGGAAPTVLGYLATCLAFSGVLALFLPVDQEQERVSRSVDAMLRQTAGFGPTAEPLPVEWATPASAQPGPVGPLAALSRRAALVGIGGSAAALGATVVVARQRGSALPRVVILDPQEPLPSGGVEPPKPHPEVVAQRVDAVEPARPSPTPAGASPVAAPAATATPAGGEAARPQPTRAASPTPVKRQLARDKDGAVLPSGRRPGDLAEFVTPTDKFYVVSKNAAADPELAADEWRLVVDGDVNRAIQLDFASLTRLPTVEVTKTIECISNFVAKCELAPFGCDLMSTATWKGVRLADVINLAGGLKPGVVALAAIAADEFTTALPIEAAMDPNTLIVFEMNGEPLPREHGYPARILVPGRYGLKNTKWVVALRPMRREFVDWYGQRNWSKLGQIKTMTRIDMPAPNAVLPPGDHRVAGVAYAGDRGIAKVEYTVDGGKSWRAAELLDPSAAGKDTWVRWEGKVTLAPGAELTVVSRATDIGGAVQAEEFSLPQPDGGSGWHSLFLKAKPV